MYTAEEVLEQVLNGSDDEEDEVHEEDQEDRQKEVLDKWVEDFDGGEQCDNEFFKENAKISLLPLIREAFHRESPEQRGKFWINLHLKLYIRQHVYVVIHRLTRTILRKEQKFSS